MKKYDLWIYLPIKEEWQIIENCSSFQYKDVLNNLNKQLTMSVRHKMKASLFKIAESEDTSWMQHIPDYLLKK